MMKKLQGIVSELPKCLNISTPSVVESPIKECFLIQESRLQDKWNGCPIKKESYMDTIQPRMSTWARKRMEAEEAEKLTSIYCGECGERYATRNDFNSHICRNR